MSSWIRKKYEIMWLRLAIYILRGRNVDRCRIISRRDNQGLWYASEHLDPVIDRINEGYKDPNYEY